MIHKILIVVLALVVPSGYLLAQDTSFGYEVQVVPIEIPNFEGIHSFVHAQHQSYWLILGGRRDGLHARQPFNSFPAAYNNTRIELVEPESGSIWSADIHTLPTELQEQLQATNMQFFQNGATLVIVGGYAFSASQGDHVTFPYLTLVDIPGLTAAILQGEDIAPFFTQIMDERMAVTGGVLGMIGDHYILAGGHRFEGRYNPMNHPTFVQTYTNAIRKFSLSESDAGWTIDTFEEWTDPVHLHRRDYNMLPQIFPDGTLGYTLFSGVFQINEDLPFLYPIDVTEAGYFPQTTFNQYLCNYHTAHVPLYESGRMHNLFFGGISQYYYQNGELVQDDNVPFVRTISRVSRGTDGVMEEAVLPVEMPGYLGASAEFVINESLEQAAPGIVNLEAITTDSVLLGYIVGGISSPSTNPFSVNNTGVTSASTTVFKVNLVRNNSTATEQILPGSYHDFNFLASPNPSSGGERIRLQMQLPETGTIDVLMSDTTGRLVLNEWYTRQSEGKSNLHVRLPDLPAGMYMLTLVLNNKYSATTPLIIK
ncbi:MAG: T9SS type A sorting domain-containing protein [Saprospiraceae bacterium]